MREVKEPDAALVRILPKQEPRLDVTYVLSQFALSFSHDGKQYVYHTLTRQLLETDLRQAIEREQEKEALIRGLFLVPEDKDECAFYNSVSALMRAYSYRKGNHGFMILPTLACNARCVYCYEEGMQPVSMTAETADATVRYIVETHADEPVRLTWFGGEPLLRPDVIDRICEGLQKAGVPYRCSMVSNGSLITPKILEKMKGLWNVTGIQISVDGCEKDYIARKRYVSYHDDYHAVIDAIDRMSEAGIHVIVRCNTDESILPGIPQFLKDFSSGIAHKDRVKLYFSPLDQIRMGDDSVAMWQTIEALYPQIKAAGFLTLEPFNPKKGFRIHHCMADGGSVVIGPDGKLYPCEHCLPETCFGNVFEGTTNPAARTDFCRMDVTQEQCRKCVFLPNCTNFTTCPVIETDCRRLQELIIVNALKRLIDRQEIDAETDEPTC